MDTCINSRDFTLSPTLSRDIQRLFTRFKVDQTLAEELLDEALFAWFLKQSEIRSPYHWLLMVIENQCRLHGDEPARLLHFRQTPRPPN